MESEIVVFQSEYNLASDRLAKSEIVLLIPLSPGAEFPLVSIGLLDALSRIQNASSAEASTGNVGYLRTLREDLDSLACVSRLKDVPSGWCITEENAEEILKKGNRRELQEVLTCCIEQFSEENQTQVTLVECPHLRKHSATSNADIYAGVARTFQGNARVILLADFVAAHLNNESISSVMRFVTEGVRMLRLARAPLVGGLVTRAKAHKQLSEFATLLTKEEHNQVNTTEKDQKPSDAPILARSMAPERLLGVLPYDPVLETTRLIDIANALKGTEVTGASCEVLKKQIDPNNIVIATMNVDSLLDFCHRRSNRSDECLIVCSAQRIDLLLALQQLHRAAEHEDLTPRVAAVILTAESPDSDLYFDTAKALLKGMHPKGEPVRNCDSFEPALIPVFAVTTLNTYQVASLLSKDYALRDRESHVTLEKLQRARELYALHIDGMLLESALSGHIGTVLGTESGLRAETARIFEHTMYRKARAARRSVVLADGESSTALGAAARAIRLGLASIVLIGREQEIMKKSNQLGLDLSGAKVIDPKPILDAEEMKGYTDGGEAESLARAAASTMLSGVDAMVCGLETTTFETVRAAQQVIGVRKNAFLVSSLFFMLLEDQDEVLCYADCALNPDPSAIELAHLAAQTAAAAESFGISPRVALLSYSTGQSGSGPLVEKVIEAGKLLREMHPELPCVSPIQYDAARSLRVARTKVKPSEDVFGIAGRANVLIFPELMSANNAYKAVQRTTGATVIGPVILGLNKPVCDVSRAASVDEVLHAIAAASSLPP
eukprot:CAMPEP_0182447414 /NCGR_PEP_ID=MMETSP1172-20130603/15838_1 /TAXON_ID=708627 /ORGANISM="Timspurckia oligopyrenoides, Strain CCMP3278" /LENGTH=782 /DNA_ID=CAMNT_0024643845 /DNA_START=147 /DNA_END=2496 /DNA_ORIENTATION=-